MEWLFTLSGARNLLISVAVFLSIDMIWLLVISKNLYAKYLGYLMTDQVRVGAAAIFYLIFVVGLLFFVITPALSKDSPSSLIACESPVQSPLPQAAPHY